MGALLLFTTLVHNFSFTIFVHAFVDNSCWQILLLHTLFFTASVPNSCSQLLFTISINNFFRNFCAQFVFTTYVHRSCSKLNYLTQLLTTFAQNLCSQLMFMAHVQNLTHLVYYFCSKLLFTTHLSMTGIILLFSVSDYIFLLAHCGYLFVYETNNFQRREINKKWW